jgi:hypothetical protein
LNAGTTRAILTLNTDEFATCRYATTPGALYASMVNTFSTTGGTTHSTPVTGLANGGNYSYYVRCQDTSGNANPDDFVISFAVAAASGGTGTTTSSAFVGVESPLSENGSWGTTGSWAPLAKNNGAFTTSTNAAARLVTPLVNADQYAEITYDQDPGSGSWVGVMTRIQGPANGSGYLAIAYAGQVRLYRCDDNGSLNFPLLAAANVDVSATPRKLHLESQGTTHRIYFNGVLMLSYTDTKYSSGQPGIAESVFGGPTVRILSFSGGTLTGN